MANKVELLEIAKGLGIEVADDISYKDLQKVIKETKANAAAEDENENENGDEPTPEVKAKGGIFYVPEYGANVRAKNLKEAVEKAKKIAGVKE